MIIDGKEKRIQVKVGIYGAGMAGKTLLMKEIFANFGREISCNDNTVHRTLLCDYGSLLVHLNHWDLIVHVYSTAGASYYEVTRPVILSGSDGLLFVIDSQKSALERNIESWEELKGYFGESFSLPVVFVFNKTDLPEDQRITHEEFVETIAPHRAGDLKVIDAAAKNGKGTHEAFETILDVILKNLNILELMETLI
mgnify:CR=1 FL=1